MHANAPVSSHPDSPDGVAFLTSILVRHPQVGSVRLTQRNGEGVLRLDFYLQRHLSDAEIESFRERLWLSWRVFFNLQRLHPSCLEMSHGGSPEPDLPFLEEAGEMDCISLVRDLHTLTVEEISLMVELVREFYELTLAFEDGPGNEDSEPQEEIMHRSLERLRLGTAPVALTGFRDDLRVLIYPGREDSKV